MKIEVVEGIRRPQIEGGCDWDVEREVLVRLIGSPGAVKELWWTGGHTCWAGNFCPRKYVKAQLSLATPYEYSLQATVGGVGTRREPIHEGRFSAGMIRKRADKINEFFGADVAGLIQRGKTVVVTDDEVDSGTKDNSR